MKKLLTIVGILITSFVNSQPSTFAFDSTEMRSFLEGVIKTHLKDKNIAGATLSFVKDGEVKLLQGYGYSDVANKVPVNPEKSLFRVGSISKMFVWTAIMQLLEKGKLSLDDPINKYFDTFQIPDTYPEPITILNLMTHTPGFEDYVLELFGRDATTIKPLEEILKDQIPARIRPPGTYASYSNHGTGMAALIIEKVSGMPFNDYVEQNITGPLGMNNTTLLQPLPDRLKSNISNGYLFENGEFSEQPFEYVPLAPVGAVSATASDMARFMMMYLQLGQLEGTVILDSVTAKLMQSPAHRHTPDVNPMRHGFMDVSQNGETIIGHGGATFWFHSLMTIWPDRNIGMFVSFNSQSGGGTAMEVLEAFTDHYFPEEVMDLEAQTTEFLSKFEGTFEFNRYPHNDIFKISKLSGIGKVTTSEDGKLRTEIGEDVEYWFHKEGLTFRNTNSSDVIVFEEDDNGVIQRVFMGLLPIFTLDKINGLDTPDVQLMILVVCLIVILLTFIYWTLMFFMRRRLKVDSVPINLIPEFSKIIGWSTSFMVILFYLGIALIFSNPTEIVYGVPGSLKAWLIIPIIIIVMMVLMALQVWRIWRNSEVRLFGKIWYSLLWMCIIATLWQWNYWNFVGWNY